MYNVIIDFHQPRQEIWYVVAQINLHPSSEIFLSLKRLSRNSCLMDDAVLRKSVENFMKIR
jgi:hypothetical protein